MFSSESLESPHADTVRIRISNASTTSEHTVHRNRIRTSAVLRSQLHKSVIDVAWSGSVEVFDMYHDYLYTGTIHTSYEIAGQHLGRETPKLKNYASLICCWGLGQTLEDPAYQDMVTSAIIRRIQGWKNHDTPPFVYALGSELVTNMYGETAKDAPLRRLMVDAAARFGRVAAYEHFKADSNYPSEFIRDLMVALGKEKVGIEEKDTMGIHTSAQVVPPSPPSPLTPRPPGAWVSEPPSPRTPKPSPFFNAENAAVTGSPRSILRRVSGTVAGSGAKQVHFQDQGNRFAEDECAYHLHRQNGGVCWRVE